MLGPPNPQELTSFLSIQEALSWPSTLVYHNPDKILWIDLDASKEFGFGAIFFHTISGKGIPKGHWPSTTTIQLVFFLLRLLAPAERNYWPTEFEIAGFIWIIKKIRHIIESSKSSVIIQTDHSAILNILQQSLVMSITSTMRLNLRLVRASQFFQQFKLNVRHKPGKEHIVPDALSRLASTNTAHANPHHSELNALFAYSTTLVKLHPTLISRILAGYNADPWWTRLLQQVQANNDLGADAVTLLFVINSTPPTDSNPYLSPQPDGAEEPRPDYMPVTKISKELPRLDKTKLFYHVNRLTNVHRLCISPSVALDILTIVYGEGHPRFSCCYEIIIRFWFIHDLTKLLRSFIYHCPQCLALQTRQHPSYGSL